MRKPATVEEAKAYASGMIPNPSLLKEEIVDRVARQFFGEHGIPKHLQAGWAIYQDSRKHREEVGYPLVPGGCLALGVESVVAGCLAEMHTGLAILLNMEPEYIHMKIERTESGQLEPRADVAPPSDWIVPTASGSLDPDKAAEEYIRRCVVMLSGHFQNTLSQRLARCDDVRTDCLQRIADAEEKEDRR